MPWLDVMSRLPEEDAVPLGSELSQKSSTHLKIVAPMFSRIANFDDLDPLRAEPNVAVEFIPPGTPIPLDSDIVILPGTKSALGDMQFLRHQGWDIDIRALARQGKTIMGICGGLQMLGRTMHDPAGVDGAPGSESGLGLLDISTSMQPRKTVRQTSGKHVGTGETCEGYEIHVGKTEGADTSRPFCITEFGNDGASNAAGNVYGTYLHGVFANDSFRSSWLNAIRAGHLSNLNYEQSLEGALDELSEALEQCLDIDQILWDAY